MKEQLKIGIIGCDTSHCSRFAALLGKGALAGCRVVSAYPGAGDAERLAKFTGELAALGVPLRASAAAVAAESDALLLLSSAGGRHVGEFAEVARRGAPVFIDKPLADSSAGVAEIAALAAERGVPVFSSSALRFSRPFTTALCEAGGLTGVSVAAPAPWLQREEGLFYYGIHGIEMLFTALGPGCRRVHAFSNEPFDLCVGEWADGRIGTFRGNRVGDKSFSAQFHTVSGPRFLDNALPTDEPLYVPLLEAIVVFLQTGQAPVSLAETAEVVRFIEAAHESAQTGRAVEV